MAPASISARIRVWLVANPGWHFACDVHEAMGANTTKSKQTVAALLSSQASLGMLEKTGAWGSYKYRANGRTAHVIGHARALREPTPLEAAFEELEGRSAATGWHRDVFASIRKRAAKIEADRLQARP